MSGRFCLKQLLVTVLLFVMIFPGDGGLLAGAQVGDAPHPLPCPAWTKGKSQASNKGIFVDQPKIFDDRTLQLMLQAAEQRLATLQLIDQTSIAARVGTLQGGSQVETGLGVQVASLPTAAVTTNSGFNNGTSNSLNQVLSSGSTGSTALTNTTGSTINTVTNPGTSLTSGSNTTLNTGTTASNQLTLNAGNTTNNTGSTQVVMPTVNPALVAPPPESGLALPTNTSVSARDILNEEMQLTFDIANLRLMLQGSLNDRFTTGSQRLKQHATMGVSVSINPPKDSRYDNAVAEVSVTVTSNEEFQGKNYEQYGFKPAEDFVNGFWEKYADFREQKAEELDAYANSYREKVKDVQAAQASAEDVIEQRRLNNDRKALEFLHQGAVGIHICDAFPMSPNLSASIDRFQGSLRTNMNDALASLSPKVFQRGTAADEAGRLQNEIKQALIPKASECPEPPGLIAILPRERTYNTANIRGSSINLSGAATTQVLTAGVTWFRHTKTYYVVQAQDTVAFTAAPDLREADGKPSELNKVSTTFGWLFRPVLGQNRVQPGLRQLFAEISFPGKPAPESTSYGKVTVTTRWRHFDKKTGAVGDEITDSDYERDEIQRLKYSSCKGTATPDITWVNSWDLPQFDLKPRSPQVSWEDAGNGLVAVTILGTYTPGTSVVIGSSLLGTGSPAYFYDPQKIRVLVPAAQLLQTNEIELEEQGGKQSLVRNTADLPGKLAVIHASARPLTSTDSLVEVQYTVAQQRQGDPHLQPLALVGGTAFGLSDNPIVVKDEDKACMSPGSVALCKLTFRAPTALVRSARKVKLRQLFFGSLTDPNEAPIRIPNDSTAQKLVTVAKSADCTLFAVQGSGLAEKNVNVIIGDKVLKPKNVVNPHCDFSAAAAPASPDKKKDEKGPLGSGAAKSCTNADNGFTDTTLGGTTLLVAVPQCLVERAKQIEVYRDDENKPEEIQAFLLPLGDTPAIAPSIDNISVKVGQQTVKVTGKHLELIDVAGISYLGLAIPAKKADDDSFILLTLPAAFPQTPGFYGITLKRTDGKDPIGGLIQVTKGDS